MKIMCIDTETGGFDPDKYSLLTVGAAVGDLSTGQILETKDWKLKLDKYIVTPKAMEVNKLDLDDIKNNGVEADIIGQEMTDMFIRHNLNAIGGHNVRFDTSFLCKHIFKFTQPEFERTFTRFIMDSMFIAQFFQSSEEVASQYGTLKALAKLMKVELPKGSYHSALYDAVVAFKIMHKFYSVVSRPEIIEALC